MLKGHVFKFQTFANEAFAHFINTFLQGNMGITKGCNLSKTSNSVTISAGYFCVMGRFLEIVGNETISDITNTGYYQLICEIDLSQTNTTSELNQALIKLVRNANTYPIRVFLLFCSLDNTLVSGFCSSTISFSIFKASAAFKSSKVFSGS